MDKDTPNYGEILNYGFSPEQAEASKYLLHRYIKATDDRMFREPIVSPYSGPRNLSEAWATPMLQVIDAIAESRLAFAQRRALIAANRHYVRNLVAYNEQARIDAEESGANINL